MTIINFNGKCAAVGYFSDFGIILAPATLIYYSILIFSWYLLFYHRHLYWKPSFVKIWHSKKNVIDRTLKLIFLKLAVSMASEIYQLSNASLKYFQYLTVSLGVHIYTYKMLGHYKLTEEKYISIKR